MLIIESPREMQTWAQEIRSQALTIGFVPTMGALHAGHASLLQHSVNANDKSVLSIFVNPAQFNVSEDFEKYPRTFHSDLEIAAQNGVSVVYAPSVDVMYPPGTSVRVTPGSAAQTMEGPMRPGHFEGVTTVVTKLFNATLPHRAYFGKKDFQQLAVIRQMARDLDFPVEIIGVDTVRENDGLALSSRNIRLSPEARHNAVSISQGLFEARRLHLNRTNSSETLMKTVETFIRNSQCEKIEYVEICDPNTLESIGDTACGAVICVAAWFDGVRLIDNVELKPINDER